MKNIEDYGFDRSDLIIATAVNSYLKNLTPEARRETLAGVVWSSVKKKHKIK